VNAVAAAADQVRPLGTQMSVFAATLVTANVSMTLTTAPGYTHSVVVAQVSAALAAAINGLGLGVGLPYTYLSAVAYGIPGVTNVASVLLNAGTSDLAASPKSTIKAGTLTIS
jgi:phage-related baseplate assembly protein